MKEKISGIVLERRRHNDTTDIVTLYTREYGRIACLSSVSASKSGKMRRARLQPLALIETEMRIKPGADLQRLPAFYPVAVWHDIYSHPHKQIIAMFTAQFLHTLLRASMPDDGIWIFLVNSIKYLDEMHTGINDFPVALLCSLLPYAGIQPNTDNYEQGFIFDMREGKFTDEPPSHPDYLDSERAAFAAKTTRINFSNIHALKLNTFHRREILNGLLKYYAIHYPGKFPDLGW